MAISADFAFIDAEFADNTDEVNVTLEKGEIYLILLSVTNAVFDRTLDDTEESRIVELINKLDEVIL